jgi:tetratricopeptide (TPR) repeat protein
MEQFDKALAIQPNFVQALSNKSFVYLQRRAYPLCIQYAQKALLLDPSLGSAHYNLGLAFFAQKHYGDALVEIKKAVKAFPENSEVYERLGAVYQIL